MMATFSCQPAPDQVIRRHPLWSECLRLIGVSPAHPGCTVTLRRRPGRSELPIGAKRMINSSRTRDGSVPRVRQESPTHLRQSRELPTSPVTRSRSCRPLRAMAASGHTRHWQNRRPCGPSAGRYRRAGVERLMWIRSPTTLLINGHMPVCLHGR